MSAIILTSVLKFHANENKYGSGMTASGIITIITVALLLVLQWPTVYSLIVKWYESETFSHGFFIFPVSVYLIWRCRGRLLSINPSPSVVGFAALSLLSVVWFLAYTANILVMQQFAVVASIPALVWSLLGKHVANEIKFPLLFLIFAVPMGEFLIPYLMDYTAVFTVEALRLTGISVFRDGMNFSTAAGDFKVAVACSGIRYLIASVVLGTLYAYLNYQSYFRRVVFILLSILVPILANGIRAYGIVMIAHLSGMKYAVGIDHIIYGWFFFGAVMLLLFMLGRTFRETVSNSGESLAYVGSTASGKNGQLKLFIISAWWADLDSDAIIWLRHVATVG